MFQGLRNTRRPFYGWWIVACGVTLVHCSGSIIAYGFSVLFDPIQKEMGWSTAALAVAFSLRSEVRSIGGPVAGLLVDRFGPRAMLAFGFAAQGLGYLALSRTETLAAFYASFILIAIGNSFCNPNVVGITVSRWFVRLRSRALAFFTTGNGLGGLAAPLMGFLVVQLGWRNALVALTGWMWVWGYSMLSTFRSRPEPYGLLPDGDRPDAGEESSAEPRHRRARTLLPQGEEFTIGQALRSRAFWHLIGATTLLSLGTTPVMTLLVPALLREGFSTETAVFAVAAIPLVSMPGRLGFGWFGDYLDKKKLLALTFAIQGLTLLLLGAATTIPLLVAFVMLYGSASGGSGPLRTALQVDYFGTRSMGTIQGVLQGFTFIDALLAPLFVGITVDMFGSYRPAWLVLGACSLLAGPVLLTMPRRSVPNSANT